MVLLETTVFTKQIKELLEDEQYAQFQQELANDPGLGAIIPGSGGLRKVRWQAPGRGKRGGVRIIYYWAISRDQVLLLAAYAKAQQVDLTKKQLEQIAHLVKMEFKS